MMQVHVSCESKDGSYYGVNTDSAPKSEQNNSLAGEQDETSHNLLAPDSELLRGMCRDSHLKRMTRPLAVCMLRLAQQLKEMNMEIYGIQPLLSTVDDSCFDETLISWLSEQQPRTPKGSWNAFLKAGRVHVNGAVELDGKRELEPGMIIDFAGESVGSVVAAVATAVGSTTAELVSGLASHLKPNENKRFNGIAYTDLVDWDRVSLASSSRTWESLIQRLVDTAMEKDTGADHLLLAAAAHVTKRPLLLWHSELQMAIRFITDDTDRGSSSETSFGFDPEAHPPPGEAWIKLALVEGDHYVYTQPVTLEADTLVKLLEEDESTQATNFDASQADAPSLFLLGNTGAGKSTLLNILAGKQLYRTETGKAAVVGEHITGSRIAPDESAASETDRVNTYLLQTCDADEPELVLIDPPGSLDTSGGLVEIRNAISIGRAMRACGPMRLGVVVPESDIMNNKGEGFVRLASMLTALFPAKSGGFGAANNMLLIVNTKTERLAGFNDEKMDKKMQQVVKALNNIKAARVNDKDAVNFIKAILEQVRTCGRDTVIHLLMHEAEAADDETSERILTSHDPEYPPEDPVHLLRFSEDEVIRRILRLRRIKKPAESCALPLSDSARQALATMLRGSGDVRGDGGIGVREMVEFSCKRRDVLSLSRMLETLAKLLRLFKAGSGHATHRSAVAALEQELLATERAVSEMLASEAGKPRIIELCETISMARPLDKRVATALCFAVNLAGDALMLAQTPALKLDKIWLDPFEISSMACSSLATLTNLTVSSLRDGRFAVENAQERLKFTVLVVAEKLLTLRDHFNCAATSSSAAWAPELRRIGCRAHDYFQELCDAVSMVQANLIEALHTAILHGCAAARTAVQSEAEERNNTRCDRAQSDANGVPTSTSAFDRGGEDRGAREQYASQPCSENFEQSAASLTLLATVEQVLGKTMPSVCGKYELACCRVVNEAGAAAKSLRLSFTRVQASDERHTLDGEAASLLLETQTQSRTTPSLMLSIKAELLVLLRMRSSQLREHCAGVEGSDIAADSSGVHGATSYVNAAANVLDAYYEEAVAAIASWHGSRCDAALGAARSLSFAEQSGAWRETIELLFDLEQLAQVESMQHACHASRSWSKVRAEHELLRRNVSLSLLSHCEAAISRLNDERLVSYAQHAADLQTLERNLWWDALCGESVIAQAIAKLWGEFGKRAEALVRGNDGATALFKRGEHARACAKLEALFEMQPLWLADGADARVDDTSASADAARRMREMHETAVAEATAIIDAQCQQLTSCVLDVDFSTQPDEKLSSAFGMMDGFLQLAESLVLIKKWLSLDCIFRPADGFLTRCTQKAVSEFATIVRRLEKLFRAIAECSLERHLAGATKRAVTAAASDDDAYVRAACDAIDALAFLKSHAAYPTLFAAIADAAAPEQSATPTDPNAALLTLERSFRRSLTRAHQKFGSAHTKLAARTAIVSFLDCFNDELDRRNVAVLSDAFKAEEMFNMMQQTHAAVAREAQKELKAKISAHDFSDELQAELCQLRESAKLSESDAYCYTSLCTELSRQLTVVCEKQLRRGIVLLQQIESGDALHEEIVESWSKLQAAQEAGLQSFLNDAQGKCTLELSSVCTSHIERFRTALDQKLIAKYWELFNEDDFVGAEHGLCRVRNFVDLLQQSISCDELFNIASDALRAVRTKQREQLEKRQRDLQLLPNATPADSLIETEEMVDAIKASETDISSYITKFEQWLRSCFALKQALVRVLKEADSKELKSCYRDALTQIDAAVPTRLAATMKPLIEGDQFLQLSRPKADRYGELLRSLSPNHELKQMCSEILDKARESLEAWHRNARDAPPNKDNFMALTPLQQVRAIKECSPRSEEYRDFLQMYRAASADCCSMLIAVFLTTKPDASVGVAACERLSEMRERVVYYDVALSSTKPLVLPEKDVLQSKIVERCDDLSKSVLSAIEKVSRSVSELWGAAAPLVAALAADFELYALLCKSADVYKHVQAEVDEMTASAAETKGALHPRRTSSPSALSRLERDCKAQLLALNLSAVMNALTSLLRQLHEAIFSPIETEHEAASHTQARNVLAQLQSAEGHGAKSLFEQVQSLEETDPNKSSVRELVEMLQTCLASRSASAVTAVGVRVKAAAALLCQAVPYSNDTALDPKEFRFLFSSHTATLLRSFDEVPAQAEVHDQVEAMKGMVICKTDEHVTLFERSMRIEEYETAKRALQGYEQLSALLMLDALKELPVKPLDAERMLQTHAQLLADAALSTLQPLLAAEDKDSDTVLAMVEPVLRMGRMRDEIGERASAFIEPMLKQVLGKIGKAFGPSGLGTLALELRESGGVLGASIVDAAGAFQSIRIEELNNATKKSIEDVRRMFAAANREGAEKHEALFENYDEFKKAYDADLDYCIKRAPVAGVEPLAYLVAQARTRLLAPKSSRMQELGAFLGSFVGLSSTVQKRLPKALAAVLAWWTMEFYLRSRQTPGELNKLALRKANAMQVICMLRLLGARARGYSPLENHLAQVPTGEGKSLILGTTATVLALLGYRVECVCYSSILSTRDGDDFASMFEQFGVRDNVSYGTWDQLASKLFTEVHGSIRQQAVDCLNGKPFSRATGPRKQQSQRVLLADEVDVFLSKDFMASAVTYAFNLSSIDIAELIKFIWKSRKSNATSLESLKSNELYQNVLKKANPQSEWFYESAVAKQLQAAKAYPRGREPYKLVDGRVMYKVGGRDEYSDEWTRTYETNCTYLDEFDQGNIDASQLELQLKLWGSAGTMAYAQLTGNIEGCSPFFTHILGVTGTLDEAKLPPRTHEVLKHDIGIKRYTYCETMYEAGKRDWEPNSRNDVKLALDHAHKLSMHEGDHFQAIASEIDRRRSGGKSPRPVLVFFKQADKLKRFLDSSYFDAFREMSGIITEEQVRADRNDAIRRATQTGFVTLCTAAFGRGTDFKIIDRRVKESGGMHVLSTFFPEEVSEEVQIIGRGGRQGDDGSFSMVLSAEELVADWPRTVTCESLEAWRAGDNATPSIVYRELAQVRAKQSEETLQGHRKKAKEWKQEHDEIAKLLVVHQMARDSSAMMKLLRKYN
uniref:SecA family profile domain-containing protein n=1 Tax=Chrysotila carterae TaxID=13221 RepID=A0A7S4BUA4_CHRCT|mmetsp:Transcript_30672/g.64565  ORF Transcript_30672/g.64565 Transcript_30672/m.64565 type:complete len:3080 (+) Transcript_30672:227-9466(+)